MGRKAETFDLVVLDPPSFSTTKEGRRFSAARDYGDLAGLAIRAVARDGVLLACCNLAQLNLDRFEAMVGRELDAAGRHATLLERLRAPEVDFPGESALKALAWQLE